MLANQQRIGGFLKVDADAAIAQAVAEAERADVAVVVVGLNADWECEVSPIF